MSYSPHAHIATDPPVSAPSLSSGDHHLLRVVVLSCLPERPRCRSTDGRMWRHPDRRSHAVLVSDVRARRCPSTPTREMTTAMNPMPQPAADAEPRGSSPLLD